MSLKEEIIESIENSVDESESKELFRKPLVAFSSANNPLYEELKDSNLVRFVANSKKCSAIFYIFYEIFSISVTAS